MPPENPFQDPLRFERRVPACTAVIFGANGDLTKRKLMPALYSLAVRQLLPERFAIIGAARSASSDEQFRARMREAVERFARDELDPEVWDPLAAEMVGWRKDCKSTIHNSYQILSRGTPNLENELWNVSAQVINGTMTPEAAGKQLQDGLDKWYHPAK